MEISSAHVNYFDLRQCLREPIEEIFQAANLLSEAADAHLAGQSGRAARAIVEADKPEIRDWVESLWGRRDLYPNKVHYLRVRDVEGLPIRLPRNERLPVRRPTGSIEKQVLDIFGWNCAYCSIPLIDRRARNVLRLSYPRELRWGARNAEKHTAFMCMDNEFDHVIPHSYGGSNEADNLVTSCAPCNCGKEDSLLEQLGLKDPRISPQKSNSWDGLTRLNCF